MSHYQSQYCGFKWTLYPLPPAFTIRRAVLIVLPLMHTQQGQPLDEGKPLRNQQQPYLSAAKTNSLLSLLPHLGGYAAGIFPTLHWNCAALCCLNRYGSLFVHLFIWCYLWQDIDLLISLFFLTSLIVCVRFWLQSTVITNQVK